MVEVRILGIDPGSVVAGFGCVEYRARRAAESTSARPLAHRAANVASAGGGELSLVEAGVLELGRRRPIPERLWTLARELAELLDRLEPQEVALEEAFYGRSIQSALRLGEVRGVVLAEAARRGIDVHQFAPARVKRRVAGHGAANKAAVARMVESAVGAGSALAPDASDALAVALCRAEERRAASIGIRGNPYKRRTSIDA